jgi:hypothetical protein
MESAQANSGKRRTIAGVIVHGFALLFGIFGAGPAYLLSNSDFSKSNAKNALNWQLFYILSVVVLFAVAFLIEVNIVGFVALLLIFVITALDLGFCLYATYKALHGTAWDYPLAPSFV